MENNNKIIPFKQKIRSKSKFRLKTEISIYICRNDQTCTCDCHSSDTNTTVEEIMEILNKILKKISKQVSKIEIKKKDSYKLTFTLLYYEDIYNSHNFKYICLPNDIKLEKLAEYLYTFISIYEYKKTNVD